MGSHDSVIHTSVNCRLIHVLSTHATRTYCVHFEHLRQTGYPLQVIPIASVYVSKEAYPLCEVVGCKDKKYTFRRYLYNPLTFQKVLHIHQGSDWKNLADYLHITRLEFHSCRGKVTFTKWRPLSLEYLNILMGTKATTRPDSTLSESLRVIYILNRREEVNDNELHLHPGSDWRNHPVTN